MMVERTDGLSDVSHGAEWPDWLASMVALNRNLGALPMVGGNAATLIEDYVGSLDAMIADIDTATEFVHVEFFILVHDPTTAPFFDALGPGHETRRHGPGAVRPRVGLPLSAT